MGMAGKINSGCKRMGGYSRSAKTGLRFPHRGLGGNDFRAKWRC